MCFTSQLLSEVETRCKGNFPNHGVWSPSNILQTCLAFPHLQTGRFSFYSCVQTTAQVTLKLLLLTFGGILIVSLLFTL